MKRPSRLRRAAPYLFISPALVLMACVLFYPMYNVFYYSLWQYNNLKPYATTYVGLQNFVTIFTGDPVFYSSLLVSLIWVVVQVTCQLAIGLALSLILNARFHGRAAARSLAFLPWSISGVLTAVLWSLIYNEHMGVLNDLCLRLGILSQSVAWIGNPALSLPATIVADLWRASPFFAINLLAAMQSIPGELYESCSIDGGSRWVAFRNITLPYLKGVIVLTTLLTAVWEFKNVDLIYNLTGGGPGYRTTTLSMYVTRAAIRNHDFGYGSALGVIAFLILLVFALIYLRLTRFGKEEDDL